MKKGKFIFLFLLIFLNLNILKAFQNQLNYEIILQLNSEYMFINGVQKEIDPGRGTKVILIKEWGRVVLPIRSLIENLSGEVFWYQDERKVKIFLDENVVELWINKPQAKVNNEIKWIDENNHNVMPIIINGRTMLPVRFVAENLGCDVSWDPVTKTIKIVYPKE